MSSLLFLRGDGMCHWFYLLRFLFLSRLLNLFLTQRRVAWRTFARHNEWQLCTCCSWSWYLQVSPRYFPMMVSTGHMRTSGLDHRTYTLFTQLVTRHLLDLKLSWGPALIKRVAHTFYGAGTVLGDFHVFTHIFWMQRFYSEWS